jgi:DNA-binding response OmpR family regulator
MEYVDGSSYAPLLSMFLVGSNATTILESTFRKRQDPENIQKHKHILVVDDDRGMASCVTEFLRLGTEWEVDSSTDPQEALNLAKEKPYDLLVTDYHMPQIKGDRLYESVRESRGMSPENSDEKPMKLLIISGVSEAHDRFSTRPDIGFLSKPFIFNELRAKVSELLAD